MNVQEESTLPAPLPEERLAEIEARYRELHDLRAVGREYDLTGERIRQILNARGVDTSRRPATKKIKTPKRMGRPPLPETLVKKTVTLRATDVALFERIGREIEAPRGRNRRDNLSAGIRAHVDRHSDEPDAIAS